MINQIFPFQEILALLNMSVSDLARYLQVSDPLVRKYMSHQREMRGKQVFSLSQLSILIHKSKDDPKFLPKRLAEEKAQLKQKLTARNTSLLADIKKTELRLAEMSLAHSKALDALRRFTIMDVSKVQLEDAQVLWIEDMKRYWEAMIPRVDLLKQHDLKVKIALLKQEYATNTLTLKQK